MEYFKRILLRLEGVKGVRRRDVLGLLNIGKEEEIEIVI